jgi:hypothetical protein
LEAWKRATSEYHSQYEQLAFPGGLNKIFDGLAAGVPEAVDNAIAFLEADPWSFRSGYMKAEIIKLLKKLSLSSEQRARLQAVVVARVHAKETPREFRAYCQLAKTIADPEFTSAIVAITENGGGTVKLHATWVLAYLTGAPIVRTYFRHSSG